MLEFIISILLLAMVIAAIQVLKRSAKKFNLTDEQIKRVQQRKQEQERRDQQD
jgi:hypothetical protein